MYWKPGSGNYTYIAQSTADQLQGPIISGIVSVGATYDGMVLNSIDLPIQISAPYQSLSQATNAKFQQLQELWIPNRQAWRMTTRDVNKLVSNAQTIVMTHLTDVDTEWGRSIKQTLDGTEDTLWSEVKIELKTIGEEVERIIIKSHFDGVCWANECAVDLPRIIKDTECSLGGCFWPVLLSDLRDHLI
ncbi:hypothetical protein TREMEDRAFT_61797 [Tremella mesenterica DSM 1558]|uniref:uncharacterized protein n=1 Tax=Tremella mesenterica (strain ATCC 24925 / CBS 8224 / DSM 1558 / NBRC 9311 / NRRL Y-6157 / RJB 2259-6 / UBC 559-6) TaxID=578456 RepID=UPI0003F49FAD|nr:uncharacterized protein TREMEDRAFT_61797 [Tremella mesenterica DSM 1558]EIW70034.1 hypothetical protein TREMEDRAFT_61797 [Tremella mesenterica DSM 1558]